MAEPSYHTLPHVLAELEVVALGIVLMRGKGYQRIEDAASQVRREAKSGPSDVRAFLAEPLFFWTRGPDGKVVVMIQKDGIDVPYAAEPGSEISA